MSVGLVVNDVIYCIVTGLMLISIIAETYNSGKEYRKLKIERRRITLFLLGVLFNIVAFFCIFALFLKALCQIMETDAGLDHPIFFACNQVFLQNSALLMVLFCRIYYIFDQTDLALKTRTFAVFVIAFIISSIIFLLIITGNLKIPNTVSWVTCAVTLCIFNVCFMTAITYLFLSKLSTVFRNFSENDGMGRSKRNDALINIITKTTLLSLISMIITFLSCLMLLFRFSLFGKSVFIKALSEWVIAIDVYSNFFCYSLTFDYYNKFYHASCKCLDVRCKKFWNKLILGQKVIERLEQIQVNSKQNVSNFDLTTIDKSVISTTEKLDKSDKSHKPGLSADVTLSPNTASADFIAPNASNSNLPRQTELTSEN